MKKTKMIKVSEGTHEKLSAMAKRNGWRFDFLIQKLMENYK